MLFSLLKIICVFSAVLAFRVMYSKYYSFLFCLLSSYLMPWVFRPDGSFPSFVVCYCAVFLIFQMQKQPRDFKTCPGCIWTVSPSMDTSAACSLFPRNENELTVGPALGSDLPSGWGWLGQRQPQSPPNWAWSHWWLWLLILILWATCE